MVILLILYFSPLKFSLYSSLNSIDFRKQLFNFDNKIEAIDISDLNVMKIVKKEDIPYREIDTQNQYEGAKPIDSVHDQKTIYIYSTHQKENYKDKNGVFDASKILANKLENKGFKVIVEERNFTNELNQQGLNYNDSYLISRNALNDALIENKGFDLIIDFHRDSLPRNSSFLEINGIKYAKCMIVLGGLSSYFNEIQKNAVSLLDNMNQLQSGIMKPILVREAYYNQDMSENMLLIEVGSEENYYDEILNSVEVLANAIEKMMEGI